MKRAFSPIPTRLHRLRAFTRSTCIACLVAGAWLALQQQAHSATVQTSLFQTDDIPGLTSTQINYTFINDDIGATYNSASLDLSSILGTVVDAIVANNPLFATTAQVYGAMAMNITNTGNVSFGWSANIDTNTGLVSITNNGILINETYDGWLSASNQNTMTATLNLGNLLDFNGNGIIDPNETLAFDGLASAAFIAQEGVFFYNADADQITVIPEPSSALLVGVGLGALAWRRRPRAT